MNTKEKYNLIIQTIDELAAGHYNEKEDGYLTAHEISDRAFAKANCSHLDDRSKNAVFMFLMNMTVIEYIQDRRLMKSYECLLNGSGWNPMEFDRAVEIAGFSDQKAFSKKFRNRFGISPKKAYIKHDLSLLEEPRSWDYITSCTKTAFITLGEDEMNEKKFGIDKNKFMIANNAANLQAFYNLNDCESELAFKLFTDYHLELSETFEYIYDYVWSYIESDEENRDARLEEDLLRNDVIHMYFDCKMTFNEIILALLNIKMHPLPIPMEDATREYFLGYREYCRNINKDVFFQNPSKLVYKNIPDFSEIYRFFQENKDEDDDVEVLIAFCNQEFELGMPKALKNAKSEAHSKKWESPSNYNFEDELGYDDEFGAPDNDEDTYSDWDDLDYKPDFDDPETLSALYEDQDRLEENNLNWIQTEEESWNEINQFCDELDSEEEAVEPVKSRKLIGYRNLDIDSIYFEIYKGEKDK